MLIHSQLKTLDNLPIPSVDQIKGEKMFHRSEYAFVKEHCGPITESLIDNLDDGWIIDVRVHKLNKGERPAIPIWHLDFWPQFINAESRMLIFGDCSLPEFVTSEIELDEIEQQSSLNNVKFKSRKINNGELISFSSTDYHKASPATKDGYRMMFRATNCNLKPDNIMPYQFCVWHSDDVKNVDVRWVDNYNEVE